MMTIMSIFRRFMRRENGAAAAEVAILFPLITWPFFVTMEAGFMQMRRIMFERAVDVVARDIRLGDKALVGHVDGDPNAQFKAIRQRVCDEALVLPDCMADLMLEMTPVDVATFQPPAENAQCVNRSEQINEPTKLTVGSMNQMMMMRFCVLYDPILPGAGIGARMQQVAGGGVAIVSTTFFVNEP